MWKSVVSTQEFLNNCKLYKIIIETNVCSTVCYAIGHAE